MEAHVVRHVKADRSDLDLVALHLTLKQSEVSLASKPAYIGILCELLVIICEVKPSGTAGTIVSHVGTGLTPTSLVHLPCPDSLARVSYGVVVVVALDHGDSVDEVFRDDRLCLKAVATDKQGE